MDERKTGSFPEAVLEGDGAVEDQMAGGGVAVIETEIALAHELEALGVLAVLRHRDFGKAGLYLAIGQYAQALGIEIIQEVLVGAVRLRIGEEVVVNAHLGVGGGPGVDPVDGGALDLTAVGRIAVSMPMADRSGSATVREHFPKQEMSWIVRIRFMVLFLPDLRVPFHERSIRQNWLYENSQF